MNGAQIHLLLNHFPLAALFFAFFILIFGKFKKNNTAIQIGFCLLLVGGASVAGAYLSGEEAEEVIEQLPGFAHDIVEEHEDAAKFGLIWTLVCAALGALGLFMMNKKNRLPNWLLNAAILLSLFTLTVLARTNHLGGQVTHTEIRAK